jgi:hypothetical protein
MVRREFNSQVRRGCRFIGCHPDDDGSRLTFRRKLRHFAIQKGNWGAAMEVAGFRFALDLVSSEGGPRFFDPVVVWITLLRGFTVRACPEA